MSRKPMSGNLSMSMSMSVPGPTVRDMPSPSLPTPAVHLRDLPRDNRGFPVPAEAPWEDGTPRQSKVEPLLKLVLAAHRACPVCGFPLPTDEPVWRIHDEYSRKETFRQMRGDVVSERDVPGHLVCMLYSALVCPFWRTAGGRLDKSTPQFADGKRGAEPSIMGFWDYAVLIDPARPIGGEGGGQQFPLVYREFDREIVFTDPLRDLAEQYEQERRRCGGRYVAKRRRHYAPVFGGQPRLIREIDLIVARLNQRAPDATVDLEGAAAALFGSGWM